MPFKQVTEQDLKGKGVIGQPAVPGLSVTEMQKSVEQVVREAAIPAHNQLCEELEDEAAAADIGAAVPGSGDIPPETPKKLQSVLEAMLAWAKEKLRLKADKADTYTKQETEEKISEGISETGFEEAVQEAKQSAQEAKEYAESINPAQFAQAEEGVTTVNASKTQNTFDIELPNSNQFVIIPNAAYASGDTFKIAAQPVAAKLPNGDSLPDGFFEAGAKVLCLLKDNVLYFTGGGNAPGNVMRYRMDDGTPGQQPEQTIWGQTSDGQDAYVHSVTSAVYDHAAEKTIDKVLFYTYKCTPQVDAWTGSDDAGWTQTVALTPFDGGPAVTDGMQLGPPMYLPTGVQATDEALAEVCSAINGGISTPGLGEVTLKVWEKPTADADIYYYGKVGEQS